MSPFALTQEGIKAALRAGGLGAGDTVLVHSALLRFGLPEESLLDLNAYYLQLLQEVVGSEGTLVFPAFSYSFCRKESFDPKSTPSSVSGLANYCIAHHLGVRSADPIFSYVVLGAGAADLPPLSNICFDVQDSMYSWLLSRNAKYVMLGPGFFFTIWHSEEVLLHTPNRFIKAFPGTVVLDGSRVERTAYFHCRYNCSNTLRDHAKLDQFVAQQVQAGQMCQVPLGASHLTTCEIEPVCLLYRHSLERDPWELLQGPALTREQMETQIPDTYQVQVKRQLYPAIALG